MRDRGIALQAAVAIVGLATAGVLCAVGLEVSLDASWLQVLVVAGLTAAGAAHGASVVTWVFRIADPPRRRTLAPLDAAASVERQDLAPPPGTMRGGSMIGVLERAATIVAIAVGQPTIIAAIVAVKAVGRFGELSQPGDEAAMRERFLVGSLASLTVAGLWGLAAWLLLG